MTQRGSFEDMSDGNEGVSSGCPSQARLLVPVKASGPDESTAKRFSARSNHGDCGFQANKVRDRQRIADSRYASDGHETASETNEVRADSVVRLGTRNPAWGEEVVTAIDLFGLNRPKNVLRRLIVD